MTECSSEFAEYEDSEEEWENVVNCDECKQTISGYEVSVYSCESCAGYDLCSACYHRGKNAHAVSLKHAFKRSFVQA